MKILPESNSWYFLVLLVPLEDLRLDVMLEFGRSYINSQFSVRFDGANSKSEKLRKFCLRPKNPTRKWKIPKIHIDLFSKIFIQFSNFFEIRHKNVWIIRFVLFSPRPSDPLLSFHELFCQSCGGMKDRENSCELWPRYCNSIER